MRYVVGWGLYVCGAVCNGVGPVRMWWGGGPVRCGGVGGGVGPVCMWWSRACTYVVGGWGLYVQPVLHMWWGGACTYVVGYVVGWGLYICGGVCGGVGPVHMWCGMWWGGACTYVVGWGLYVCGGVEPVLIPLCLLSCDASFESYEAIAFAL